MTIGLRAQDLGRFSSVADLAAAVKAAGLDSVQLVAWKCFDFVSRSPEAWTADLVKNLRRSLVDAGIGIPLVGAYFNWFAKDELASGDSGGMGRRIFRESLAAARSMGASHVGTELEGYAALPLRNPKKNRSDEAMEHAAGIARDLQATALEADAYIAVEGVWWHVLHSPERVRELKDRSGADRIRFIFDPVNFLNARNWRQQRDIIDRALELYGEDLMLIHCKDFRPTPFGLIPVPPGTGRFDYPWLMKRLKDSGRAGVPMILEGVTGKHIRRSASYLRSLAGT
jgi:sugar phosphate isomerase/epimerase